MKARMLSIIVVCVVVMTGSRATAAELTGVVLQLHQVKAVDECGDWVELGADEMRLGAIAIGPTGSAQLENMALGKFGHDGSTRNYSTPRKLVSFTISGSSPGTKRRPWLPTPSRAGTWC
jgi:hypothetical protein